MRRLLRWGAGSLGIGIPRGIYPGEAGPFRRPVGPNDVELARWAGSLVAVLLDPLARDAVGRRDVLVKAEVDGRCHEPAGNYGRERRPPAEGLDTIRLGAASEAADA